MCERFSISGIFDLTGDVKLTRKAKGTSNRSEEAMTLSSDSPLSSLGTWSFSAGLFVSEEAKILTTNLHILINILIQEALKKSIG
ncbi:hypothetical protein N7501_004516 [Penicillium viridicatum]|nr:hypothetical protein N7501_004516 [Penicillium viridicatum]